MVTSQSYEPVSRTPRVPEAELERALREVAILVARGVFVRVFVGASEGTLVLEVSDDGRGGATAGGGSGLIGLNDRVEALRGRLTVTSPPGAGTTLRAEFPLSG